jgi:multicomponent Na+:H+ antiporter subunit G
VSPIDFVLTVIGYILIGIGAFCQIVAGMGMNRFPNFFVRLHAATIAAIGGSFVPIIGCSLLALSFEELGDVRFFLAGGGFVAAVFLLILAPVGSHLLAKAAYFSKAAVLQPKVVDALEEDIRKGEVHE